MPKKMMHVAQWWTVILLQHCCKYRNVPHPYPGHPHPAPSPISCWHPHLLHHPSPLTFTPAPLIPLIPGPFPWPEPSRPIHCHLSAPIPSHLRPLTPSHRCPHPNPLTPITPPPQHPSVAGACYMTHPQRAQHRVQTGSSQPEFNTCYWLNISSSRALSNTPATYSQHTAEWLTHSSKDICTRFLKSVHM